MGSSLRWKLGLRGRIFAKVRSCSSFRAVACAKTVDVLAQSGLIRANTTGAFAKSDFVQATTTDAFAQSDFV
jgi:hypothetical protein